MAKMTKFSSWNADAVLGRYMVDGNKEFLLDMVKGSMQQKELTILNMYTPNTRACRFIKQVLNDLQRDLDSHTTIVGDFNSLLSILDRSMREN